MAWKHRATFVVNKSKWRCFCVCGKHSPLGTEVETHEWYLAHHGIVEKRQGRRADAHT